MFSAAIKNIACQCSVSTGELMVLSERELVHFKMASSTTRSTPPDIHERVKYFNLQWHKVTPHFSQCRSEQAGQKKIQTSGPSAEKMAPGFAPALHLRGLHIYDALTRRESDSAQTPQQ
ncbi:hypothetical protein NDU88_001404 [Pleurodeles waltl]|uniref:Uncharacterized protein n=1 Tax=Pleurodeles waltl TaxID=8319 RepID=A0AAV7P3M8_PLEWA|nr:hypothetical protein NDU88_001404 [Pleurodeles waltl]